MSDTDKPRPQDPEPHHVLPERGLGGCTKSSLSKRLLVLTSAFVDGLRLQWRTKKTETILALVPVIVAAVYCFLAFLLPPRNDVPDIIQWPEGIAPGTTNAVVEPSARHSFPSLLALYWPEVLVCSVTLLCLTVYAVVVLRARARQRLLTPTVQVSTQ